jgi:hypothetical protein
MQSVAHRFVRLMLMLFAFPYSAFVSAAYVFNSIDYPGAQFVQSWGINNTGQIAIATDTGAFVYQGGNFVPLPVPPGGLLLSPVGLNDAGAVAGGAYEGTGTVAQGFVLSSGTYQFFSQSGWTNTVARAIGNSGLVTGHSFNDDWFSPGSSMGFIYNTTTGVFTNFVPPIGVGLVTAQGINAAGQVVGSGAQGTANLTAFLREPDGSFNTFRINGYRTAARGINDNGLIVGWVITPSNQQRAFVGNSLGFELLQCPLSACPGVVDTFGQGINNDGQIVGGWTDVSGITHGFIATPASLPTGTTVNGAYTFNVNVVPNVTIFIDPAVSLGFDYEIGAGNPKFASVRLPIGIGDNRYTIIVHGQAFTLVGGELFDFADHGFAKGVVQFRVVDIEASAGLDPSNGAAFPTGLTFTAAGTFTGTMTPLCRSTPIPDRANGRGLSPCSLQ